MKTENIRADLQCVGHTILRLNFQNDLIFLSDKEGTKKSFELSHEVVEIKHLSERNEKFGTINLFIKVNVEENNRNMALDMAIQGCFRVNEEVQDKEFERMLSQNGLASIYSASRAIVTSFTSQALNGGSVILPMINVLKYSKELQRAAEE